MTEEKPKIHIEGFGIAGYKSFGPEIQWAYPFGKVNVFIGPNNAGKSNLLTFIAEKYRFMVKALEKQNASFPILENEYYKTGEYTAPKFGIPVSLERIRAAHQCPHVLEQSMDTFHTNLLDKGSPFLLTFERGGQNANLSVELIKALDPLFNFSRWQELAINFTGSSAGNSEENIARLVRRSVIWPNCHEDAKTVFISAKRECNRLRKEDENSTDKIDLFDGTDLVDKIGDLQTPLKEEREKKQKQFEELQEFVREVLENPNVKLDVPRKANYLIVEIDGRPWKLEELGTGIREVVLLAAAATIYRDKVICLEEPEIHLHPMLQKRLINHLNKIKTNNQYFIATHSAHIINCPDISIFRIQNGPKGSVISSISKDSERFDVCTSLGYGPADLLMTNCIIWVEGPSDRIYLNHWISKRSTSDLVEGVHYSILFYGGRILSHFTGGVDDEAVKDLIKTRNINQRGVVFIDSDKDKKSDDINETKQRVLKEFNSDSNKDKGFGWVTEGRETENYFSQTDIEAALKQVHPDTPIKIEPVLITKATKNKASEQIELAEEFRDFVPGVDKVKLAKHLTENDILPKSEDFDKKMDELVVFIWKANGKEIKTESTHCEACKQPKPALASK